jgi:(R)-2-hydroxyacyl-CoA dehydratese activating ATPase
MLLMKTFKQYWLPITSEFKKTFVFGTMEGVNLTDHDNHNKAYVGVDVGSLATKSVVMLDGSIAGSSIIPTGVYPEKAGQEAMEKALSAAGLGHSDLGFIVATGYGRITAKYANKLITEITCHAKGAGYLRPTTRTVIDMGGQDCKVIKLDCDGNVEDFVMNDKCAAGTGRFLEVMANVFKISLDELGPMTMRANSVVPISSTCTVFAESEVISMIARGEPPEDILKGVHQAISNRVAGMASRVGPKPEMFFSGGVAKNAGMKAALETALKFPVYVPEFDPQLVGALGAAVLAKSYSSKV